MAIENESLLLVLPVPFRKDAGGRLLFEKQACNGLERWADNFPKLIVACPLEANRQNGFKEASIEFLETDGLPSRDRMEFIPLPYAYTLGSFVKHYRETRELIGEKIRMAQYLSFAIGGLVGDWAAVAALEAAEQKRKFSIWTDRVEHKVIRNSHLDAVGVKRTFRQVKNSLVLSPLMRMYERHIIALCDLGLFHGRDCFEAYAPFCRAPQLVHDIHLKPEDRIPASRFQEKLSRVRSGGPLRIVYAGRAAAMKGPLDWLQALAKLRNRNVSFEASWIGDGPLLDEMRAEVTRLGLNECVKLPGFVSDRAVVMNALRESDLFLFCHKTPESPRCLIESLMSGTPITGYDSSYPRDLAEDTADQLLVPLDDITGMADRIASLDRNREQLSQLLQRSYELGGHYSDQAVFHHRSELIKNM